MNLSWHAISHFLVASVAAAALLVAAAARPAAAQELIDIDPTALSSHPRDFYVSDDTLYFTAGPADAPLLWFTTGGSAEPATSGAAAAHATHSDAAAYPRNRPSAVASGGPSDMVFIGTVNGLDILAGTDSTTGRELWRFDGTDYALIEDIVPGQESSLPAIPVATTHQGMVYFFGANGSHGNDLYRTDGLTVEYPRRGMLSTSDPVPDAFMSNGDALYMYTITQTPLTEPDDSRRLWRYFDGNVASLTYARPFASYGGKIWGVGGSLAQGAELWSSDNLTEQVQDLMPGTRSAYAERFWEGSAGVYVGARYGHVNLIDEDGTVTSQWTTSIRDGIIEKFVAGDVTYMKLVERGKHTIPDKTLLYSNKNPSSSLTSTINFYEDDRVSYNDGLYVALPLQDGHSQLYRSRGGPFDRVSTLPAPYTVHEIVAADDRIYVGVEHATEPGVTKLWGYNDPWTSPVIADSTAFSNPRNLTPGDSVVFFIAEDAVEGAEVWMARGPQTAIRAHRISSVAPGDDSTAIRAMTAVGDELYFAGWRDGQWAAYHFDGTTTHQLVAPADFETNPNLFAVVGDDVYFYGDVPGNESDGIYRAEQGTAVLHVALPRPLRRLVSFDEALYFVSTDAGAGTELWSYDGHSVTVTDLAPGPDSSDPRELFVTRDRRMLYFIAEDGLHGREVFRMKAVSNVDTDEVAPQHGEAGLNVEPAFPNPFSHFARVVVRGDPTERVVVDVYDILGRRVKRLHSGYMGADGRAELELDGSGMAPGVYVIAARTETGQTAATRVVLTR